MRRVMVSFLLSSAFGACAMESNGNKIEVKKTSPRDIKQKVAIVVVSHEDRNLLRLPHQGTPQHSRSTSSSPSRQESILGWRNSANWFDNNNLEK